ncbi:casein kinase isoform b [Stylonychia lemnae]|uniref:Casein kinase I n=1 Tax=Stylonychia lemnae TaxID=5949 RepID=A0A078AI14_STYLE|nr:casein kinase isoform b [Stylonychia lemnae]|eukprot:CDW80433.1 casein kinase isoform b [Stylonychia lemnae]
MLISSNIKQIDPPDTLKGYQKIKKLGHGSIGEVWHYQKDGQDYAIKFEIQNSHSMSLLQEKTIEMLYNEIYSENDEKRFELVGHAIRLLKYLHQEAFFVNRDIKPDNFMGKDGQLKLIDFGTAKKVQELKISNEIFVSDITGTPITISVHAHNKLHSLQGDDVISCLYSMLMLFEIEGLTWYKNCIEMQKNLNSEQLKQILEKKKNLNESNFQGLLAKCIVREIKRLEDLRFESIGKYSTELEYENILENIKLNIEALENQQNQREQQDLIDKTLMNQEQNHDEEMQNEELSSNISKPSIENDEALLYQDKQDNDDTTIEEKENLQKFVNQQKLNDDNLDEQNDDNLDEQNDDNLDEQNGLMPTFLFMMPLIDDQLRCLLIKYTIHQINIGYMSKVLPISMIKLLQKQERKLCLLLCTVLKNKR